MKKLVKEIKEILIGIFGVSIFMGFIYGMCVLAELLASLVTMDMIMTVVYIALGISIIYLFFKD